VQSARQDRLQRVESAFEALLFDSNSARAFGRLAPILRASGRKPRGANLADYLIAATALAHDLPLYTLDGDDFAPLAGLVEIVTLN
jgi:predicted nucleic acid-binding protein